MVLPSTGNTISFNDIRIELGVGGASPFDIASAAGGTVGNGVQNCQSPFPDSVIPHNISEWWSYNGSQTASLFLTGDDSTISCAVACAGTAPFSCFDTIYNFGSGYYSDTNCKLPFSGYIVQPTNCSSGTKEGQTCYEISNGSLISQTTCTTCLPNGDPCPPDPTDCCSGGCCNGFCDANPC